MSKHLRKLGEYNKAVAAALGGLATVAALLLGAADLVPGGEATLVSLGAGLTTASVFLTRNQENIDDAGDWVADYLDR